VTRRKRWNKHTIYAFVVRLGAVLTLLRKREIGSRALGERRRVAEVLVRKVPDNQQVRK